MPAAPSMKWSGASMCVPAMPSYIEEPEAAACKWVSIRDRNRERFDLGAVKEERRWGRHRQIAEIKAPDTTRWSCATVAGTIRGGRECARANRLAASYSVSTGPNVRRRAPAKPARASAARIVSGGTQAAIVPQ
jgi:hypothetical protein